MSLRIMVTLYIEMAKIQGNYSRVLAKKQIYLWGEETMNVFSLQQTDNILRWLKFAI